MMDVQWLMWNDVPAGMSENEYRQVINDLKEAYKKAFTELNRNSASYAAHTKQMQESIEGLQKQLEEQRNVIKNYSNNIQSKLSLKERVLGKLDLKKRTRSR